MKKNSVLILILGVFFAVQPVIAQIWLPAKRLTFNSGGSSQPAITVDSNDHIHVVWSDNTLVNQELFYKKSTDGGATWTTKRLTFNSDGSYSPAVAVDTNDHIHVVWEVYGPGISEIFYKKSTDAGTSWTTKRLTWNPGYSSYPAIAIDSSNHIHVVWEDNTPGASEIYYKKSTDGGTNWTTKRLSYNPGWSARASIAVDSDNRIYVVWSDDSPANKEIYCKLSTDGGTSWTTKRLTWTSGDSYRPKIFVTFNNGYNHVVWIDETSGSPEVYYKKSTDKGVTWMTKRLTWTSTDSMNPAILVDFKDHIHVVWNDSNPGNNEIFRKKSTDEGMTWIRERLTWMNGESELPVLAVDSDNYFYVVWRDNTPGNFEIYYKKEIH
jgi:hypothetical protein